MRISGEVNTRDEINLIESLLQRTSIKRLNIRVRIIWKSPNVNLWNRIRRLRANVARPGRDVASVRCLDAGNDSPVCRELFLGFIRRVTCVAWVEAGIEPWNGYSKIREAGFYRWIRTSDGWDRFSDERRSGGRHYKKINHRRDKTVHSWTSA